MDGIEKQIWEELPRSLQVFYGICTKAGMKIPLKDKQKKGRKRKGK